MWLMLISNAVFAMEEDTWQKTVNQQLLDIKAPGEDQNLFNKFLKREYLKRDPLEIWILRSFPRRKRSLTRSKARRSSLIPLNLLPPKNILYFVSSFHNSINMIEVDDMEISFYI